MHTLMAVLADYVASGQLADKRPLPEEAEAFEALVEYEMWRAAFRRGEAHLVTTDGQVWTWAKVERGRERRWRALRKLKGSTREV